jgi:hypothetical protein
MDCDHRLRVSAQTPGRCARSHACGYAVSSPLREAGTCMYAVWCMLHAVRCMLHAARLILRATAKSPLGVTSRLVSPSPGAPICTLRTLLRALLRLRGAHFRRLHPSHRSLACTSVQERSGASRRAAACTAWAAANSYSIHTHRLVVRFANSSSISPDDRASIPCHGMPCRAMPCRAVPCHAARCHAQPLPSPAQPCMLSCRAMPRHALLCPAPARPCRAVPCRAVPSLGAVYGLSRLLQRPAHSRHVLVFQQLGEHRGRVEPLLHRQLGLDRTEGLGRLQ